VESGYGCISLNRIIASLALTEPYSAIGSATIQKFTASPIDVGHRYLGLRIETSIAAISRCDAGK
jgi:hypothetical protein